MRMPKVSGLVVLAVALAGLILALGALQWRWVREASQAERGRMQGLLDARALQFAHDFDRELTTIYGWFLALPLRPGEPGRSQAERAAQWFAETPRAHLVRELFLVRARRGQPLRLERFDASAERFLPVEWPERLVALRARLTESQPSPGASSQVWRAGPRVDVSIPAVVVAHPVLRWVPAADTSPQQDADVVVTVAVLDREVLVNAVLPELVAKHFPDEPGFTFKLLVTDDRDQHVVFSSPAGLTPEAFRRPDASTSLLRVRNEFLERVPGDRVRFTAEVTGGTRPGPGGAGDDPHGGPRESAPRDVASPWDPRTRPPDRGSRVSRMQIVLAPAFATGQTVLVVPDLAPGSPRWTLSLVHAQGSLEAAVARTRRWNLGASLGVLALLAGSVALALVASQRAQRLARDRMEFVAGISHELRTPLAVIRSAAENLADGVVDSGAQVQKYGTLIADEGRKLSEMVDQVLTFSTLESGHALRLRPAAVDELVADVVRGLAPAAEAAGMRIETEVRGPLPPVLGDAAALGRVMTNLVTNAIKYAASGGWIGVLVEAGAGGRLVRITVADRGPGIAHQDQRRVFEPFFRGHAAVAAQIHGNGLGLDLVRRITERHGGRVSLESEPGRGSRFTVELPAASAGASSSLVPRASLE
jgi:signal transduction histidine kinase